MTQRDWDKELAKIDKQLASLPDEELAPPAPQGTGMPRGVAAPAVRAAPAAAPIAPGAGKAKLWAYSKLSVAVAAGVGVWFWPWAARCGLPLAGLVSAGALVAVLGAWSAAGTWRQRMGRAHVLSLLVIASAAVLVAREVLPRVGYAYESFDRPARWSCQADIPAAPAPTTTPSPGGTAPFGAPGA